MEDLVAADWILAESEGIQSLSKELLGPEHTQTLNRTIVNDHPPFMINTLQRLDLLSIIPDYTVDELTKRGSLKKIEYPHFQPTLSAGLIHLIGRHITPSMQLFADVTREFMKDVTC